MVMEVDSLWNIGLKPHYVSYGVSVSVVSKFLLDGIGSPMTIGFEFQVFLFPRTKRLK